MRCFCCLKFLYSRRTSQPTYHTIQPASLNASIFGSSLLPATSSHQEITTFMSQLHKSRRSSLNSFKSTRSGYTGSRRRHSEMTQEHFEKLVEKRRKRSRISKKALEMYREVAGVLILTQQLRSQTRRTPPLPESPPKRKKTV